MATIDPKWEALVEATKEPLRLLVLAAVSYLITVVVPQINDPIWVAIITGVLRWLDSLLHQWGKATKNDTVAGGLTRF